MRRRLIQALLLIAVLIGAVDLYRSDRALFRYPEGKLQRAQARISRALVERHQLALLYTADEQPGRDWVSGTPVEIAGTTSSRGHFGRALNFDGRRRTFAVLPLRWSDLGASFTMALWVKLEPTSMDQEILFTREDVPLGFKLDRGRMSFFLSTADKVKASSYVFTNYEQFVHIAAVVDGPSGTTRLYENGVLRDEMSSADYLPAKSRLALGRSSTALVSEPLQGRVDEILVWQNALSSQEVARVANQDLPALELCAGSAFASYRHAVSLQALIRGTLKLVDLFNPALHPGRARRQELPEINLVLSKSDEKYFARAHRNALRDGRLDDKHAHARTVDVLEQGRVIRGRLSLAGSDGAYAESTRRSYVLEVSEGEQVWGLTRLRMQPPESAGWLESLVETQVARMLGAPTVSNGLCRLVINGERQGVYCVEDYQTLAAIPGLGARRFEGVSTRTDWLRFGLSEVPPISREQLLQCRDEVYARYRPLLIRDARSPLSGREIQFQLRESKGRIAAWRLNESLAAKTPVERWAAILTPFFVLGSNPSPDFVLHDLPLASLCPSGVQVRWSSTDESVLTAAGRVTRPPDGRPRPVVLTAQFGEGSATSSVALPFRVMPAERTLGAFCLWTDDVLQRLARVKCAVEYYPAGWGSRPQRWLAAQENQAGISWRGHTSMKQAKKPMGLALPVPHGLWGTTNVSKINLVNPFRDPTLMRNSLSYDLFRRFARPGQRRDGLPVSWVEVFLNGKYFGLYEASPPVRAEWLGLPTYVEGEAHPTLMFKAQTKPASLAPDSRLFMRQTEPSRSKGNWVEEVMALERFIEDASPKEFAREVGRWLDVDNLLDFHLLLNLTENYNGWPFDFTIHDILVRPAGAGQPFFLVPFDFDTTWDPYPVGRYHSQVFERMLRDYPGYREHLAQRWVELRPGPLDLNSIEAWIEKNQALLDSYVQWDDRRWAPTSHKPYEQRVAALRTAIRRRFAELDTKYGYRAQP